MKKLMALCFSLLMVLSMCSFTVFAEETVSFEDISNGQIQSFIVSDLTIPEGATVESSNETVISTTGKVTRPLLEDAEVTLTVNGTSFDVTVKAQSVNALHYNDFSTATTEWEIACPEGATASSIDSGKFHVIIAAKTDIRAKVATTLPTTIDYTKPVNISFDISSITFASPGADIRLDGGVYGANGKIVETFPNSYFARLKASNGFLSSFWDGNKTDIDMKYDPLTGEFWIGGTPGKRTLQDFVGAEIPEGGCVKITGFYFYNASDSSTATFDMDNFVVYQEVSAEDVLKDLTNDEKIKYFSHYLTPEVFASGQSLASVSSNLTFSTGFDMEAIGASLEWTTSDPSVIETNGTIHPKDNTSVNAVIQGHLTVGEETITTKPYNIKLAPKGTVECTEAKLNWDFENATVGTATSTSGAGYSSNSVKGMTLAGNYEYVNDKDRGMILSSTNPGTIRFYAGQAGPGYDKRYVYGFDYKFSLKDGKTSTSITTFMRGNSSQQIGTIIGSEDIKVGDKTTTYTTDFDTLWASKVPCYEDITKPDVWHHIDIDYNATKNVYSIYVDDNLINSIPGSSKNPVYYAMYWLELTPTASSMASFQLDNVYVNKYTDSDIVKADGALRSAVYNAAARETGENGQSGPYKTINRPDLNSVITSGSVPTPQSDKNGATLTWKVNGAEHTEETYTAPAGAKTATFEVTASYNGKSATQTFTNRFAPVEIISSTVEDSILKSVTVEGNYTGKKLAVVSVSKQNNAVNKVKLVEMTDTIVTLPDDSITDNGNEIYFYVFDEETLLPYAFKR